MNCPKCGGEVWDNREKKASGKFSAKSPDFSCKDKDCGWVKWPERGEKAPSSPQVQRSGPKWTWTSLSIMYKRCQQVAESHVGAFAQEHKLPVTIENLNQATATLFIEACRNGVADPIKKPAPPIPPPDSQEPDDDSTLPF
jgi:hypothetical protein